MLLLMRRVGQSIIIDDDITITITQISAGQAMVGIDAPKEMSVHREEVYDRITSNKKTRIKNNDVEGNK